MRFATLALLAALSSCAHPALAAPPGGCRTFEDAKALATEHNIKPLFFSGKRMSQFIQAAVDAGVTDIDDITFVAVIDTADGAFAFFGNSAQVCGPVTIPSAVLHKILRAS